MGAMAELAVGSVRVVLRRLLAMDAGAVLALFSIVAEAAVDAGQLFRMRHFFDVTVTSHAFQSGMRGRFQGGQVKARGRSGLPFPDTRAGIMATCTVIGTQLCRLLAA